MFDEIKKYKTNGHFFFKKGDRLSLVSKEVPNMPGVYYVLRLAAGGIELVYIGKSGAIEQSGVFKDQGLKGRINNKQDELNRRAFFDAKIEAENITALDIYWFVTMGKTYADLPGYVEGLLMQRYFELYGRLPLWNSCF